MYREDFQRVIGHLKRALRKDQRLTVEECYQLLRFSEPILMNDRNPTIARVCYLGMVSVFRANRACNSTYLMV